MLLHSKHFSTYVVNVMEVKSKDQMEKKSANGKKSEQFVLEIDFSGYFRLKSTKLRLNAKLKKQCFIKITCCSGCNVHFF